MNSVQSFNNSISSFFSETFNWHHCEIARMTFTKKREKRISDSDSSQENVSATTQPVKTNFRELSPKMCSARSVLVFCVLSLTLLISSGSCFNVDVSSKVIHAAPRDSCDQECMFGFSVAQHRERGVPWYETFSLKLIINQGKFEIRNKFQNLLLIKNVLK